MIGDGKRNQNEAKRDSCPVIWTTLKKNHSGQVLANSKFRFLFGLKVSRVEPFFTSH